MKTAGGNTMEILGSYCSAAPMSKMNETSFLDPISVDDDTQSTSVVASPNLLGFYFEKEVST